MTTPSIDVLYDTPRAPNPRRVRLFLAEKRLSLPTEVVTIMDGSHFRPEYRDKVGSFHVPALGLSDGTILTETVAICRYIEALHPEPNLMGTDPLEKAVVEMWGRRVEFQLLLPIAQVLRHGNPAMAVLENPQCPEWAEVNRPRVVAALDWLEGILAQTPYIAGQRFTIADITALVAVEFMRAIRQALPETHTATHDWLTRLRAREGYVE
ncbi:glutathione S-transferase [Rubricella aquisinus]|uniref:Glutathione S-transferase n=1 Tax=Rubricella aquisinus TaxID=2028108 RepID=A0A840WTA4_9RHOB|nr:glutathione S-transferase [Rubricella aquisinus]MBB5514430.1 glutathione S-transferase [Rubricella aquisinus]